ncbi:MAG: hypothetical protein ACXVRS_03830 [Gaiellaceae bacterium]
MQPLAELELRDTLNSGVPPLYAGSVIELDPLLAGTNHRWRV